MFECSTGVVTGNVARETGENWAMWWCDCEQGVFLFDRESYFIKEKHSRRNRSLLSIIVRYARCVISWTCALHCSTNCVIVKVICTANHAVEQKFFHLLCIDWESREWSLKRIAMMMRDTEPRSLVMSTRRYKNPALSLSSLAKSWDRESHATTTPNRPIASHYREKTLA